ncbi:hypothetical protein P153DRAFT_284970 [Dothidotthia symphoricarpi CBS 119687]|uniref:Zn(2)-C6 fungal-type domain-containing protein n=1 Tax=Dothidotthia symphoricarpi CBS 119687 TaxID=1392245 RepID=A0A6A6AMH9_9PLEO|nr:uncharacterized protein P153DRAFT_284970 [Dothidotthia symphoricarpi CBS 119687]KAF2132087.1 hypothetical protein P153DRAFT_284970 [Dothidotthia symphoricarpi CBS 119687]
MVERQRKAEPPPRKRALVSCDRCKVRRARCIRESPDEPCADCKLSGVQCESKLPRKERLYGSKETLSLRYRALESLIKGLFPQENTQDTNILFKIAAARHISMPAPDDFTLADIFNTDQRSSSQQYQQPLPTPPSLQQAYVSPQTNAESVQSVETLSPAPTSKGSRLNPFSEVQQQPRHTEELIPTRNGVPHYFGPSSSFRLATTIRALVARCKAASGGDFPTLRTYVLSDSAATNGSGGISLQHASSGPSDEEYMVPDSRELPSQDRRAGHKRNRSHMEESQNQWERPAEVPSPDTIGDLLPSRSLADALVSAYFDHVHIFLPVFHRSMFQFRLEATYSRKTEIIKDCTDMGWLACLALVFSFGCQQLHEHDPEQADRLRSKYLGFVKTHFRQLLITTSLANVQALVLLNNHHHTAGQKSSSWLLIGLAARMAITMGMHRDRANMEFDPIERNTRRTVWFSIYVFEKILCNILGRPTGIDDREMCMKLPDAPLLEQKSMSAEFMLHGCELMKLSYSIRQRAYFDSSTAEEQTPTLNMAETLLRECEEFSARMPAEISLIAPVPREQRARNLLFHIYMYHTRCTVSRDFLVHRVERRIQALENKLPPDSQDWKRTMALSEDCIESAHRAIQCIMDGAPLGIMGYSWLDLFFVFHAVLIVCADFLARPKDQQDSPKDFERKEAVREMLNHVRGLKQLAPTYRILGQIAMQFASITGVTREYPMPQRFLSHSNETSLESQSMTGEEGAAQTLADMTAAHDNWYAHTTTDLGLDFFEIQGTPAMSDPAAYPGYFMDPTPNEVDDWTSRPLRGMH